MISLFRFRNIVGQSCRESKHKSYIKIFPPKYFRLRDNRENM